MFSNALGSVRRSIPTIAIAGVLVAVSATSGATAALVITGKDIKDNTVTSKDIKNKTLVKKDFKPSTISALEGDTGPAGPAGAPGAPGVSGYQIVTVSATIPANDAGQVVGSCPAGKKVLSAAAELTNAFTGTAVNVDLSATFATAYAENIFDTPDTLNIDVVCAVVS